MRLSDVSRGNIVRVKNANQGEIRYMKLNDEYVLHIGTGQVRSAIEERITLEKEYTSIIPTFDGKEFIPSTAVHVESLLNAEVEYCYESR